MQKMKIAIAALMITASCNSYAAQNQPQEGIIPDDQLVKAWTLHVSLAAISKKIDSDSASSTEIHGLPSYKECMQIGFKLASQINEALAKIGNWQGEPTSSWRCNEETELLKPS